MAELDHLGGRELGEVDPDGVAWGAGGFGQGLDELGEEVVLLFGRAAGADVAVKIDEVVGEGLAADEAVRGFDGGEDDLMNRILWFDAKGNAAYPVPGKP